MTATITYGQREAVRAAFATLLERTENKLVGARFNVGVALEAQGRQVVRELATALAELSFVQGELEACQKAVGMAAHLHTADEDLVRLMGDFDEAYAHRMSSGVQTHAGRSPEDLLSAVHQLNGFGSAYRELRESLRAALR